MLAFSKNGNSMIFDFLRFIMYPCSYT